MVENAHATGEPGMVFIDRINDSDPIRLSLDDNGLPIAGTEDIEATNPCGEQPLGPGDACNLGSINLAQFIDGKNNTFHWARLANMIALGVRFLDDVIDANVYPFEFIARATLNNRRIGLGLMGFADSLIKLGIAYDSEEAILLAEEVMAFFQVEAHKVSAELAAKRGNFPNWPFSVFAENKTPRRNATVTTIAPTGTISIIAGTSSGIEPLFAVSFVRRVLGGTELIEVNPLFEQMAKARGFYSDELMRKIAHEGTVQHIDEVPADVKKIFVCAHDIDYLYHVRMQAAFQSHTDNAVSKTINFPHDATREQVESAYMAAWDLGLKGITVYRDASRRSQVLNIGKTDPLKAESRDHLRDHLRDQSTAETQQAREFDDSLKKRRSAGRAGTVTSPRINGSLALAYLPNEAISIDARRLIAADIKIEKCPECGAVSESFLKYEACSLCLSCGYTKC